MIMITKIINLVIYRPYLSTTIFLNLWINKELLGSLKLLTEASKCGFKINVQICVKKCLHLKNVSLLLDI